MRRKISLHAATQKSAECSALGIYKAHRAEKQKHSHDRRGQDISAQAYPRSSVPRLMCSIRVITRPENQNRYHLLKPSIMAVI